MEKQKNRINKKEEKAITLIALVITIIVLLILAGIAIAMLGGENGLFIKAQQAKQDSLDAQEKENVILESYENRINDMVEDNDCIISYNGNNATKGDMENQRIEKGIKIELKKNSFERDGYTFLGWSENENALDIMYTDCQEVIFTEDKTLYAIWKSNIINIYNYGDENETLTGGIICSRINGNYVKNLDNIYLNSESGSNQQRAKMSTKNYIDTTGYHYVKAEIKVVNYNKSYLNELALYSINGYDSTGSCQRVTFKSPTSTGETTITLDISNYQGKYYVGYDIDYRNATYIYKIWLE